ncbi:MAG: DUF72 domain-containing protein [Candidatus Bathyarchaeia archaeon]
MIGTSGWSYDEWVGPFYDRKKGMFTRYAKVFSTTEVNSTFYRYPTERMVRGWYRAAPPGFVFALKLPQVITHEKWLRLEEGVEDDTERFLDLIRPLAEKLGPILIQLRPKFNYEDHAETLERFLETLPRNYEWAAEFRHRSWMRPETWEMLRRHGVAYTIVDEPLLPPEAKVTAEFAYIRWHGRGARPWYDYDYSPEELEEWVPRLGETMGRAKRVYGYFNNHFGAKAVKNAVEMLALLGSATPEQRAALRRIVEHGEGAARPAGVPPLESFTEEEGLSVADLLMRFTTTSRLRRAEGIGDDELDITGNSGGVITAAIRDYAIVIDRGRRVLRHDCDDWRKGLEAKRMCKHIAKLFLSLPRMQAKEILTDIWERREGWRFEPV